MWALRPGFRSDSLLIYCPQVELAPSTGKFATCPRVAIVHTNHGKKWFAASLTSRPHLPIKRESKMWGSREFVLPWRAVELGAVWGYVCGRVCAHVYVCTGLCWELSLGCQSRRAPPKAGAVGSSSCVASYGGHPWPTCPLLPTMVSCLPGGSRLLSRLPGLCCITPKPLWAVSMQPNSVLSSESELQSQSLSTQP